jgi:Reeler domain
MWKNLVIFCVVLRLQLTTQFPTGGGTSACETLTPSHGANEPQISVAPITLTLSTQNLRQNEAMTVTIEAETGFSFLGFMIQARTLAENSQVIGRFEITEGMRTVNCVSLQQDSVATHSSSTSKTRIEFRWQAATTFVGIINFQ